MNQSQVQEPKRLLYVAQSYHTYVSCELCCLLSLCHSFSVLSSKNMLRLDTDTPDVYSSHESESAKQNGIDIILKTRGLIIIMMTDQNN